MKVNRITYNLHTSTLSYSRIDPQKFKNFNLIVDKTIIKIKENIFDGTKNK